jgi:hypothetical protein
MLLTHGTTFSLKCSAKDKTGTAINLTGHTVIFRVINLTDEAELFSQTITSFTGGGSNEFTISQTDEQTDSYTAKKYRYQFEIQTSQGQEYKSRRDLFVISKDQATEADRKIRLNDNIFIHTEDDATIIPGNPTAPTITSGETFSIDEDVSIGTTVGTVNATGLPAPTFSLSDDSVFSVNSSTGVITTVAALDFETTNSYSLTVTATNSEGTANQSITININDIAETDEDAYTITEFDSIY